MKIRQLCKNVAELNLTLTDDSLRDPEDRATVLHTALINDHWNVAAELINSTTDEQLLVEKYSITGQRFIINLTVSVIMIMFLLVLIAQLLLIQLYSMI